MCGIVFVRGRSKEITRTLAEFQYRSQSKRGKSGFGFVYLDENGFLKTVRALTEEEIIAKLREVDSNAILFHHRLPTSTQNVINATHPFKIRYKGRSLYVVHNGVLQNEEEVFEEHKKLGLRYRSLQKDGTFNDSETLAWELALYLAGDIEEMRIKGSVALIAIETSRVGRPESTYYFRNSGNPLMMFFGKDAHIISSEGGDLELEMGKLFKTDFFTGEILKEEALIIPTYSYKKYSPPSQPSLPHTHLPINQKSVSRETSLVEKKNDGIRISSCSMCKGRASGLITCELCDVVLCWDCRRFPFPESGGLGSKPHCGTCYAGLTSLDEPPKKSINDDPAYQEIMREIETVAENSLNSRTGF